MSNSQTRRTPQGHHGGRGFSGISKGSKFKPGTVKRLLSYLSKYKVRLIIVMSVSYTHLDVYKRQVQYERNELCLRKGI